MSARRPRTPVKVGMGKSTILTFHAHLRPYRGYSFGHLRGMESAHMGERMLRKCEA
jgi:hypothetical protein